MERQHNGSSECSERVAALRMLGLAEEEYQQLRAEGREIRKVLSKRLDPIIRVTADDLERKLESDITYQ